MLARLVLCVIRLRKRYFVVSCVKADLKADLKSSFTKRLRASDETCQKKVGISSELIMDTNVSLP